jgi:hypothetical protein
MTKKIATLLFIMNFSMISIYSQELNGKDNYSQLERFNRKDYNSFREYIAKNAFFPPEAYENTGVLLAGFTLTVDGLIENVFSLNSLSPTIDNQLLDLIESSKGFWKPLPDSVLLRKKAIVIIPIVYCLKNTEYRIQGDNFKLKLEKEIVLTALTNNEQLSATDYKKTIDLETKCENLITKSKYSKAYEIILELLRREPLNTEYYTKLIVIETNLGNNDVACKNLLFVKTYLNQKPDKERLGNLDCK